MNGSKPSLTMKSGDRIPSNPWGKDERRSNGKGGKENKQKFHRRGDKLKAWLGESGLFSTISKEEIM